MLRSLLFLPGNNPNMLGNGDILGADGIIFDLEDAVAVDEKDAARILVRNCLRTVNRTGITTIIRINAPGDGTLWQEDLAELVTCQPDLILVPKVSRPEDVQAVSECLAALEREHDICEGQTGILALIETALGVEQAFLIAQADPRIQGIFLGAEDLTADLQCVRTSEGTEIFYARNRVVLAARAAGVAAIDTPFTDVNDEAGSRQDAVFAKSLGFSGKAAISPRHVKAINQVFSPTAEEIAYAYEVLEAIEQAEAQGKGAISLYGKMIDKPIVLRARQVLSMEQQLRERGGIVSE
ncbi:MAG: HpcH/HpaI aldolase/citrate lyase family protein [Lachnospiraceae bacterium]